LVVKKLKSLFSFLTIFPVAMDKDLLVDCASSMWAFPLIGAFIGLLAGLLGWIGLWFLPGIIVGGLVLGLLLLVTGLHHTDGLLDFGDGIMVHGSAERKIEVMHDKFTGAGGLCLGIVTILVSGLALGQLGIGTIVFGVVVVEVCAKLAMVVVGWAGRSVHQGMNSPFLEAMHGREGNIRLIGALVLSLVVAVPLLWLSGVFIVVSGVLVGLFMVVIAHKHFNGVTGDVFGATNELARMVCLVILLVVI
jgi:adenosylcobinamide-GDP ribazoletransferase